jgi:hypothetical protein
MIFEFLITYQDTETIEIIEIIRDCLFKVLEDNLNEFDDKDIERMIIPRIKRLGTLIGETLNTCHNNVLFGFTLDLPEETASPHLVINEFVEALNIAPIIHLIKFEDHLLKAELSIFSEEIYSLEMKLRRVLSLVYLYAYQDSNHYDPYDLLCEESTQPIAKDCPKPDQMKAHAENQFFHLTFSQYVDLNRRPEWKFPDLIKLVRNKDNYDSFRDELSRLPVEDEDDAVLLAGLKEKMGAIEAMRNCCAHSRKPSKRVEENYRNARPLLDQLLNDYLIRWEIQEMFWISNARKAVEIVFENAQWNEDEKTITLFDRDDNRIKTTVTNREELEQYLCQVADTEFYANAPREDNEFVDECDDIGIVWEALNDYEQKLEEFFSS